MRESLLKEIVFHKNVSIQSIVTGMVTDSNGVPLFGASILEKGTNSGVTTDFDGTFKINIKDDNAILIVSYLGFQQREISLAGQTNLSIVLEEDSANLDEIIVTGYTSERKSDLTGAVSIIKVDESTDQPLANVNELVQGRSAGVEVLRSNAPGGNAAIRIRGFSTVRNNDPLYVIDGVPTTTGINLINPNDIESLQVLKDASSASIYGSRAANGVVVITTKKGKQGKGSSGKGSSGNGYYGGYGYGHDNSWNDGIIDLELLQDKCKKDKNKERYPKITKAHSRMDRSTSHVRGDPSRHVHQVNLPQRP